MVKHTQMGMAALVLALGAAACDNPSADKTAPATNPPVPPPANTVTNTNAVVAPQKDPLAGVANRDRITLDPNASKIDPPKDATLLTGAAATVRESPRGSRMEVIETTANVKEIERDGDYFLITYPDPKGSAKTYAGWVYRDSLVGEGWSGSTPVVGTPQATGKLACDKGETHLRTTRDFCGKPCKDDTDCSKSGADICDGLAFKVNESTNKTSDARYCISGRSSAANDAHGPQHGSSTNLPVNK